MENKFICFYQKQQFILFNKTSYKNVQKFNKSLLPLLMISNKKFYLTKHILKKCFKQIKNINLESLFTMIKNMNKLYKILSSHLKLITMIVISMLILKWQYVIPNLIILNNHKNII
jgi:uncharacterized pyridoxamine 5'-phosphate oxidase family protein